MNKLTHIESHSSRLPYSLIAMLAVIGTSATILQALSFHQQEALAVIVTMIIWVAVVLIRKVSKPFIVLMLAGLFAGILSAVIQQVAWGSYWDQPFMITVSHETNNLPFDIIINDAGVRAIVAVDTVLVSTLLGCVGGAIATGLHLLRRPASK